MDDETWEETRARYAREKRDRESAQILALQDRLAARERIMATRRFDAMHRAMEGGDVTRKDRPQSGYFDSHGDGHPGRDHYMPAHGVCEPRQSPETVEPVPAPAEPDSGPQTGA